MSQTYEGIIIEESLESLKVLKEVKIVKTKIEKVTERHKTPWVDKWTLHTVEIPEENAEELAFEISNALDPKHQWYCDFKNDKYHYIVFRGKVFKVDRTEKSEYEKASKYGFSLGIPPYQLDFSSYIINKNSKKLK